MVAAMAGCAGPPAAVDRCAAGQGTPNLLVTLFFGRSMPAGGEVSELDWRRFEDRVVAPSLPDGFTVFDASGAWLSPAGHSSRHEPTKVLIVSLPVTPSALAPVQRIRTAYQIQFHQQLVGMTVAPACASF